MLLATLNPIPGTLNRGLLLLERLGRPAEALPDLDAACRLDSGNAAYLRARGLCRRAAGQLRPALEDLSAALRLAPDDAVALANRGLLPPKPRLRYTMTTQ